ncbi:unnamed protein product [Ectocarpus sp. 13 AM-2016]
MGIRTKDSRWTQSKYSRNDSRSTREQQRSNEQIIHGGGRPKQKLLMMQSGGRIQGEKNEGRKEGRQKNAETILCCLRHRRRRHRSRCRRRCCRCRGSRHRSCRCLGRCLRRHRLRGKRRGPVRRWSCRRRFLRLRTLLQKSRRGNGVGNGPFVFCLSSGA